MYSVTVGGRPVARVSEARATLGWLAWASAGVEVIDDHHPEAGACPERELQARSVWEGVVMAALDAGDTAEDALAAADQAVSFFREGVASHGKH